jgi:hypothetical protein
VLAYIFWHSPLPCHDQAAYESSLARFHGRLEPSEIEGFTGSAAFLVTGATFAASGAPTYEDWYLVDDFAALGRLNEAAVAGSRKAPHDAVAAQAGAGAAGLYALRGGVSTAPSELAVWFSKPPASSYGEIFDRVAGRGALWQRQMTLGPSPELCLLGDEPLADLAPTIVVRRERTVVAFAG